MGNKRALILYSGGLDSTTVLHHALSHDYDCTALTIDYNQRHSYEVKSSQEYLRQENIEGLIFKIDLSQIGGSALTDNELKVPMEHQSGIPITYVPARNTIFLSIASAYAEKLSISEIFIGVNQIDYSGYPDCRPDYIKKFQELADLANKRGRENNPIKLWTPLLDLNKEEIIKLAFDNHVPLDKTWSCYSGNSKPCGKCDSCRIRNAAYEKWLNNNNKK